MTAEQTFLSKLGLKTSCWSGLSAAKVTRGDDEILRRDIEHATVSTTTIKTTTMMDKSTAESQVYCHYRDAM